MKNIALVTFVSALFFCLYPGNFFIGNLSSAYAQADWKQEYAVICAKTQNAMSLSVAELQDYIVRCDKLQERIDAPDGLQTSTEKKVYTKRLKMCRDLYDFALKHKNKNE